MIHRKSALLLGAASLFWAGDAAAQCVRHVYNNSGAPWSVEYVPQTGTVNCSELSGGACTVAPGGVLETDSYSSLGTVNITDSTGNTQGFTYGVMTPLECPEITHDGDTGAVAMNDPADGDIHMWGPNSWNDGVSAKLPPKRRQEDVKPGPSGQLDPKASEPAPKPETPAPKAEDKKGD